MAITQKLRKIGGVINSTDLNYNFDRMQEDLQMAVEGVVFNDDYSEVETIADRDSIPEDILVSGLWVAVSETGMVYEYNTRNDLLISGEKREFGINGDVPITPHRIDGDPSSEILYGACYVCNINDKSVDWEYFSPSLNIVFNHGDWAVYKNNTGTNTGTWVRIPKWIPIININSILEQGLIGKLEDLHTEDKSKIVNAINEIHDDLGTIGLLTTDNKLTAVNAINELDGNIGELSNLTTDNKNNTVEAINEVDAHVGPIENLTTSNKTNAIYAINELDSELGDLTNLKTEEKNSLVGAINEVHDDLGTLDDLMTHSKDTAVSAINELDTNIGDLLMLDTVNKSDVVSGVNEVLDNLGFIGNLNTVSKDNTVNAINELKAITDTLRGASIIIGRINIHTIDITEEALNARALDIMGGTEVKAGWTLIDLEQHEWHYNGENWQDMEQVNIYPAQNDILGTVIGSVNGDISITDGHVTVRHASDSDKLNGQSSDYYINSEQLQLKADKNNVLELNNTVEYIPTEDYHPTTKKYVDMLSGGASWGNIVNNIQDQEDLIALLEQYAPVSDVLVKHNMDAYTPLTDYSPATKLYVDEKVQDTNSWGKITGDIIDQQDLQHSLLEKQNRETAWNVDNLVASNTQPEIPDTGYIIWIDTGN